jgi:acetyl-CoA carboxylase biotin carboxyl carrier protein
MDLKQIQELIRFVAKAGVSEVQLEQDDFKIIIKTTSGAVMQQAPAAPATQVISIPVQPVSAPQQQASDAAKPAEGKQAAEAHVGFTEEIKSPMIGTFYRKPSPDKPEFIKVGDKVSKGQVVCVIEAMKLFNEIESDIAGTVVKVLADDMSPVEYDQPLFLVEP